METRMKKIETTRGTNVGDGMVAQEGSKVFYIASFASLSFRTFRAFRVEHRSNMPTWSTRTRNFRSNMALRSTRYFEQRFSVRLEFSNTKSLFESNRVESNRVEFSNVLVRRAKSGYCEIVEFLVSILMCAAVLHVISSRSQYAWTHYFHQASMQIFAYIVAGKLPPRMFDPNLKYCPTWDPQFAYHVCNSLVQTSNPRRFPNSHPPADR